MVGIVALPLAMALAIAVGVPPQHGLYTAIVAGFLVAALGGSRTQVTGPTAAFIVLLAPIGARYGLAGLLVSGLAAGGILVAMGLLRMGRLIEYVPHPVVTGFTAGIGTVIATLQLKDLMGLHLEHTPEHFLERVHAMWQARGTASTWELAIGLLTFALLVAIPYVTKRIPAPILALPIAAFAAHFLAIAGPRVPVATIASRFETSIGGEVVRGIPQTLPVPALPWHAPGRDGEPLPMTLKTLRALANGAFTIAMLGAIESLLSAVVADGMARTKHEPDAELLALGIGNIVCPFLGGIAATGAIARTATNIRSGARSPVAAMTHALTILTAILAAAPLVGHLPMASLAALLILVAWRMSEAPHFVRILREAPTSDIAVLVTCYGLTVAFDMVIAVSVGVGLAALLFMRRMAEVTQVRLAGDEPGALPPGIPDEVIVYDICGPLFFGAAHKAAATLARIDDRARVVILRMDDVPAMDASGLVALESALEALERSSRLSIVSGLRPQPAEVVRRGKIAERQGILTIVPDLATALRVARAFLLVAD